MSGGRIETNVQMNEAADTLSNISLENSEENQFIIPSDSNLNILQPNDKIPQQWVNLNQDGHSYIDIIVSEVHDPGLLWVQLHENKKKLKSMMADIAEFYGTFGYLYAAARVNLCDDLFVIVQNNNRFYRAKILRTMKTTAQVFLIDFGQTTYIIYERIWYLYKDYGILPAQAIRSKLFNLLPPKTHIQFSVDARNSTRDMVYDKILLALICENHPHTWTLELDIIDTYNTVLELHINYALVEQGHAELGNAIAN